MTPGKFIVSVLMVKGFCLWLFTSCTIAVPNGCGNRSVSGSIAGSSDGCLCASESLTAFISGSGDIICTGSPRVEDRIKGTGSIKARR